VTYGIRCWDRLARRESLPRRRARRPREVLRLEKNLAAFARFALPEIYTWAVHAPGPAPRVGWPVAWPCSAVHNSRGERRLSRGSPGFEEKISKADLVITGEGAVDAQTAMGKAPGEVVAIARKLVSRHAACRNDRRSGRTAARRVSWGPSPSCQAR